MREEEIEINKDQEKRVLELKIQALQEELQELSAKSSDRISDLRIEITLLQEDNNQLRSYIEEMRKPEEAEPTATSNGRVINEVGLDETIEGELVQEED